MQLSQVYYDIASINNAIYAISFLDNYKCIQYIVSRPHTSGFSYLRADINEKVHDDIRVSRTHEIMQPHYLKPMQFVEQRIHMVA